MNRALTPGPHLTVPAHIDPPPTPQPEHQPGPPAPPLITASPPSPPPPPPPPPPPSLPDHAPQPAPAPPNNPPAPPAPPPVKDNNPASAPAPIPAHNDPPAPVPAPADPRPPTHAPSPAGPGVRPPKSGGEAPAPVQENKPPVKPNNPAPRPPIVIAGNTIKAPSDPAPSAITIDSHTIHAGGPAVIVKGTPVSLAPSGVVVVGDHQSITLAPPPPAAPAAFVAEGQTFNIIPPSDPAPKPNGEGGADKLEVANPPPTLVVGGQTLSAGGGAVTVDGTSISLGTDVLVVGTKTQSLAPLITAADGAVGSGGDGIGNMIISQWSGLGPNPSSPVTNGTDSVTPFSGDAMAVGVGRRLGLWIMAVALLMAWR